MEQVKTTMMAESRRQVDILVLSNDNMEEIVAVQIVCLTEKMVGKDI